MWFASARSGCGAQRCCRPGPLRARIAALDSEDAVGGERPAGARVAGQERVPLEERIESRRERGGGGTNEWITKRSSAARTGRFVVLDQDAEHTIALDRIETLKRLRQAFQKRAFPGWRERWVQARGDWKRAAIENFSCSLFEQKKNE